MAPERKIPMMRLNSSILDTEFGSIRERFEDEMKRMEDEMSRFRQELLNREQQFLTRSFGTTSGSSRESTSHRSEFHTWIDGGGGHTVPPAMNGSWTHSTSTTTNNQASESPSGAATTSPPPSHRPEANAWLDELHSPLIQDSEDGKCLKLRFDVSQYAPDEIHVKTIDNKLQVHAKHEEKSENRSVYREYNREFLLPKDANPENIRSSLSKDGILTVEAPLPALPAPKERNIAIEKP